MRNSATLFHSSPLTRFTASEMERPTTADRTLSPAPAAIHSSPWHSPIPYLFGGLAAMLGLIAFALLILACSYWKLSGRANDGGGDGDVEGGAAKGDDGSDDKASPVFEEKLLVIMAGELKPTFLATPTSNSRNASFNDHENNNIINSSDIKENKEENGDQNDHSDQESH